MKKTTKKITFIVNRVFNGDDFDDAYGFDTLEQAKQHIISITADAVACGDGDNGKYFISKVISVSEVKCAVITEDVK